MEEIMVFVRFASKRMDMAVMRNWMTKYFSLILGYSPRCLILDKGWMGCFMKSSEDVEKLL